MHVLPAVPCGRVTWGGGDSPSFPMKAERSSGVLELSGAWVAQASWLSVQGRDEDGPTLCPYWVPRGRPLGQTVVTWAACQVPSWLTRGQCAEPAGS